MMVKEMNRVFSSATAIPNRQKRNEKCFFPLFINAPPNNQTTKLNTLDFPQETSTHDSYY